MKLTYRGTGTVRIEGAGEVRHGGTIEVPRRIAETLIRQDPEQWQAAADRPKAAPSKRGGK